jgi:hypothetical protein
MHLKTQIICAALVFSFYVICDQSINKKRPKKERVSEYELSEQKKRNDLFKLSDDDYIKKLYHSPTIPSIDKISMVSDYFKLFPGRDEYKINIIRHKSVAVGMTAWEAVLTGRVREIVRDMDGNGHLICGYKTKYYLKNGIVTGFPSPWAHGHQYTGTNAKGNLIRDKRRISETKKFIQHAKLPAFQPQ